MNKSTLTPDLFTNTVTLRYFMQLGAVGVAVVFEAR